ncbi:hypothetical protein [uncultured Tateyamaria sp.]|uniref:hypothetical protein n=1 Tax=uncultured Tateyamaria sp. TaxID=455651 RepID=UPI0026325AA7|nr:hypothetical protein [uncultured Tateyamaria sp.]
MIRGVALIAVLALVGCEEATRAADDVGRRSAKVAVNEAIVTRFPAVPKQAVAPFTDCVIDNADALEIREFARDAVIGVTDATANLVRTVIARPETQQCIVRAGSAALTL